jgi:hypothetical protein
MAQWGPNQNEEWPQKSAKKGESYFDIFFAPFAHPRLRGGQMPFSYRIKLDRTVLDGDSVFAGFGERGDKVGGCKIES